MSARSNQKAALNAPVLPQVNLLPPEIRAARALRPVKRWVAISAVLALVVVGGTYLVGTLERSNAQAALDAANEETTVLLAEQQKYAEVPKVTGALAANERARKATMATEVLWADYLGAVEAVIPEEVSIDTLAVDLVTPGTQAPLESPALAKLTFQTRSLTPPDVATWLRSLNAIPGFSDANLVSLDVDGEDRVAVDDESEDADAEIEVDQYYVARTTVLVTVDALSHRFDTTAGEGEDAE